MQPGSRYQLKPPSPSTDQPGWLSRDGTELGLPVDGRLLEAQFDLPDGSALLMLSDDSPYDEMLHVYLLGPGSQIEDGLEAGSRFGLGGAGVLELIRSGDAAVEFDFFKGGPACRIEVLPRAELILSTPQGWRYKRTFSRHRLRVTESRQA